MKNNVKNKSEDKGKVVEKKEAAEGKMTEKIENNENIQK